MDRQSTNLIGMSLIIGAAVGFTLGLVLGDGGTAAVLGAVGAGLGIVIGAVVSMLRRRDETQ
jgi:hypothetical protein